MKLTEAEVHKLILHYLRNKGYSVLSEYKLNSGRIDLYVPSKGIIIEIKASKNIKHAIGQLVTYKQELISKNTPVNSMQLIHFNRKNILVKSNISKFIRQSCNNQNIKLIDFSTLALN